MSQNKRRLAHIYIMLLSLCAALSLMPSAVSAQHTIKTVIVDSITRIPLPGANAIVFSTDSSFIKGTTSDTAGVVKFDLSPHSPYILRISMIGYKSLFFNIPKTKALGFFRVPRTIQRIPGKQFCRKMRCENQNSLRMSGFRHKALRQYCVSGCAGNF